MKAVVLAFALILLGSTFVTAQFKSQAEQASRVTESIFAPTESASLFGWFNPEKFHMRHSLSFSYATFGGQGVSLGMYTNSMMYEIANNLNARADISLSYSPYNSLGFGKNNLSSIYLSRAEVNYRPWENVAVQLQYQSVPYGTYRSSYFNPFYRESGF